MSTDVDALAEAKRDVLRAARDYAEASKTAGGARQDIAWYAVEFAIDALTKAAQAPKDFYLRTKVADLLHLLQHATISVPSRGDDEQAYRVMDAIRDHLLDLRSGEPQ